MKMKKNMKDIKELQDVKFGQLRPFIDERVGIVIRVDHSVRAHTQINEENEENEDLLYDDAEYGCIKEVPQDYDRCNVIEIQNSDQGIEFFLSSLSKWKRTFKGLPFTNAEHPMVSDICAYFNFEGRWIYFRGRSSDHRMVLEGQSVKFLDDMSEVEEELERLSFREGEEYVIVISKIVNVLGWEKMLDSPDLYARYMAATGMSFDEVWEECFDYYERGCNLNGGLLVRDGQVTWLEPAEAAALFNEFDKKYYTDEERVKLFGPKHDADELPRLRPKIVTREELQAAVEKQKVEFSLGHAPKMKKGLFELFLHCSCLLKDKLVEKDFRKTYGDDLLVIEARDDWSEEDYMRALDTDHKAYLLMDYQGYYSHELSLRLAEIAKKKAVFFIDHMGVDADMRVYEEGKGIVYLPDKSIWPHVDEWDITKENFVLYDIDPIKQK